MATIVHILLALLIAILRAFTEAFLLLFTRAAAFVLAILAVVGIILILTGTIGLTRFKRKS